MLLKLEVPHKTMHGTLNYAYKANLVWKENYINTTKNV
jgi:hypothetical protein